MTDPPSRACAQSRALVVCRRAAGPFNTRICDICASMGSQPAALHVPLAAVFSENRNFGTPAPAHTRRGAFLHVRFTSNRCVATRQSALWAGRHDSVSSLALKAHDWPCPATTRGSLRASAGLPQADIGQAAKSFCARRDFILLAAPVIDPPQPTRIDPHFQPTFLLRLVRSFRAHRLPRCVRLVLKSMAHLIDGQSVPNVVSVSVVDAALTGCPYRDTLQASSTQRLLAS